VAETSFPVAGGAGVTDAAYERLMGPITGSGRYNFSPTSGQISTPLIFADNSGRQIKANANQSAIVRGFRWESGTTPPVLSLDANTSGNPRLDLIVLRLDRSNFTVRLGKTNGTPATVPAAPAAIQDAGSTGVWELPVARVRVASSGTTGQPFIQTTDVTATDWWLGPPSVVAKTGQSPPATHGMVMHQYDTGRMWRAVGSSWVLAGEIGAWTELTSAGGWTATNLFAQRINGLVYFQCYITLNVAARPAMTELTVCTLPAAFRPLHDVALTAWMTPNQACLGYVEAATGIVSARGYGQTFPTGGKLIIQAATWPYV
jgi:hypothetical protein